MSTPDMGTTPEIDSGPEPDQSDPSLPTEIRIEPSPVVVTVNSTQKLEASAYNDAGEIVSSGPFEWTSSDTAVAEVTPTGTVIARTFGTAEVTATLGDLSAVVEVTVRGNPVASIELSPASRSVTVGDRIQMVAILKDAGQADIDDPREITWTSSDDAIATVSETGNVLAVAEGDATITVGCEGVEATAAIEVRPPIMTSVSRVEVTPAIVDLIRGETVTLSVTVFDMNNEVLDGQEVVWTSDDPAVVTVDASGLVTSVGNGTATVEASVDGFSDSAEINVSFPIGNLAVGGAHACVTAAGNAYCWGNNIQGQLGRTTASNSEDVGLVSGDISFRSLSLGENHSCGISAGDIYCWGSNARGQLGVGDTMDRSEPTQVFGNVSFSAVSAGRAHTCAVDSNERIWCWGANSEGQLGNNASADSPLPVSLSGSATYQAVSAGYTHTCGVRSNGDAYCWGDNSRGQLGSNNTVSSLVPVAVLGGYSFTLIEASDRFTCGVGTWCWGRNDAGQLGHDNQQDSQTPVFVASSAQFVRLSLGRDHACGIAAGGSVLCWGDNGAGQLGNTTTTSSLAPTAVTMAAGAVAVELGVGTRHSCFLTADEEVYCFGDHSEGQMGPSGSSSNAPVRIGGL